MILVYTWIMRKSRLSGSMRAKTEWLSYSSTTPPEPSTPLLWSLRTPGRERPVVVRQGKGRGHMCILPPGMDMAHLAKNWGGKRNEWIATCHYQQAKEILRPDIAQGLMEHLRTAHGSLLLYHQHRAFGVADDPLRHGAHQEPFQAGAAVAAHDDEAGLFKIRRLDDALLRPPHENHGFQG